MTRKEAIEILSPDRLSNDCYGGVLGCPCGLVVYKDRYFHFDMNESDACSGDCTSCWREKLSISETISLLSVVGDNVVREYMRKKRGKENDSIQKQVGKS